MAGYRLEPVLRQREEEKKQAAIALGRANEALALVEQAMQELTRETPNSILISHTTYQKIKPWIRATPLGMQTLRAGESRMEVFEVIDRIRQPAET